MFGLLCERGKHVPVPLRGPQRPQEGVCTVCRAVGTFGETCRGLSISWYSLRNLATWGVNVATDDLSLGQFTRTQVDCWGATSLSGFAPACPRWINICDDNSRVVEFTAAKSLYVDEDDETHFVEWIMACPSLPPSSHSSASLFTKWRNEELEEWMHKDAPPDSFTPDNWTTSSKGEYSTSESDSVSNFDVGVPWVFLMKLQVVPSLRQNWPLTLCPCMGTLGLGFKVTVF